MTEAGRPTKPYRDLAPGPQALLDRIIDGFITANGCGPGLTRSQTRLAIIALLDRGEVQFVPYVLPDHRHCCFAMELRGPPP